MAAVGNSTNGTNILDIIDAGAGVGQNKAGIAVKAFILNIAVGLALFAFELSGFMILKSSAIGRRIYQPKTYLVQHRLRVDAIPANPITWLRKIFSITDEELKAKCGLDGYFFIRLIRAMIVIFVPAMVVLVVVLLPINYTNGAFSNVYQIGNEREVSNVTGLDTLSWQNVPPTSTDRRWAHLVCAVLVIGWTLYRIYREKVNFIDVRQQFLTSPEQRIKASARTILVTNIPGEFRTKEALKGLYDVFVDNDDHRKLTVWINRDYSSLRALVAKRSSLRHALEKEELSILRKVNKKYRKSGGKSLDKAQSVSAKAVPEDDKSTTLAKNDVEHHAAADDKDAKVTFDTKGNADAEDISEPKGNTDAKDNPDTQSNSGTENTNDSEDLVDTNGNAETKDATTYDGNTDTREDIEAKDFATANGTTTVDVNGALEAIASPETDVASETHAADGDEPHEEFVLAPESKDGKHKDGSAGTKGEINTQKRLAAAFADDCDDDSQLWHQYLDSATQITLVKDANGKRTQASAWKFWVSGEKEKVPKIAWLRSEIANLTVRIEHLLSHLDDEETFPRQNSAFIQFDRQMAAHMACSLTSHHKYGRMSPRFVGVAPHEIVWPNMGVTSLWRLIRTLIAIVLFIGILFLWGLPTTFLGILSQLDALRSSTSWLAWLRPWPSWVISLISGPLVAILLALLVQLIVPALMRKLAVLIGAPTRSQRETITQHLYFTFLLVELVLVTSISSGIANVVPVLVQNPANLPSILANNLPRSSNYFFNYLIIQALGFSGSVLFQYLRLLYITLIWPWFTQTPREEAFLQTTIPHQMWANVYGLMTNFAAIGLIFSIISPLILVFVSLMFSLFWIAYRHNYYFVQRNKVDTHGLLFNNAMSHLFAGVYVLELALIGLFFLQRNTAGDLACTPQGIIMIIVLVFTAIFHFILETNLGPLYESLPVTLEDPAVDAEKERFLSDGSPRPSGENVRPTSSVRETTRPTSLIVPNGKGLERMLTRRHHGRGTLKESSKTAANARHTFSKLTKETAARVQQAQAVQEVESAKARKRDVQDQLGAALESFPDELTDLSPEERDAELHAAFQDPVTREPAPVIWVPQDPAGVADDTLRHVRETYGSRLPYSDTGAFLRADNKCEITQPAPDVRPDWLLDWVL